MSQALLTLLKVFQPAIVFNKNQNKIDTKEVKVLISRFVKIENIEVCWICYINYTSTLVSIIFAALLVHTVLSV